MIAERAAEQQWGRRSAMEDGYWRSGEEFTHGYLVPTANTAITIDKHHQEEEEGEYYDESDYDDEEEDEEEDEEDEEEVEEDELRRAARAGILLLEKIAELQHENRALRFQVKALKCERPRVAEELERRASELELLREERRQSMLEVTQLQGKLRATSQLVISSLDREQRLKHQKEAADAALAAAEDTMRTLRQEMVERSLVNAAETSSPVLQNTSSSKRTEVVVSNPAATYDSNQRSAFTLAEHEELLAKWQRTTAENESLLVEMKSLKKDLDAHKRRAAKLSEMAPRLEHLEKKVTSLQLTIDTLSEELTEERALTESQRTMIAVYKNIVDERPFSTECTCALHSEDVWGVSVQAQLLESGIRFDKEVRERYSPLEKDEEEKEEAEDREEDILTVDDGADGNHKSHHDVADQLLRATAREAKPLAVKETVALTSSYFDVDSEDAGDDANSVPKIVHTSVRLGNLQQPPLIKCLLVYSFFPALALQATFNR